MSGGREVGRRLGVRKIFKASRSGEHANGLRNREGRVGARRACSYHRAPCFRAPPRHTPMKRQPSKIVAETVTAYRNGMTMKELADRYKVTVPAIAHRIFRYKMITGETVQRGPDRVVIETVGEYRNGKTMKQIAAQYGVTHQNISYRVNTYRRLTGEIVRRNQNRS
jgi:uncharacterized protein (DUF433 family)